MRCESASGLVEPYLDDELDAALKAQVEEHLAVCRSCAETHAQLLELRAAIRTHAPYHTAPAHLRDRIRNTLPRAKPAGSRFWRPAAVAASVLLAASLAWNVVLWRPHASQPDLIAQQVLASHVRSLIGTHLLDVTSSDQHTVKPWFNGKLDFSPEVKDWSLQGFPLIGGRIDYLSDRPVAALVCPTPARSNGKRMIRYCRISGFSNRGNLAVQTNHRRFPEGVSSDFVA